ncbi:MAG: type IV pilin [Halococcoides sp.]
MDRATSPVVGVVLLVCLTVVLAGSVAAAIGSMPAPEEPRFASIDGSVDADTDRIVLVHRRGDPLDVDSIEVRIAVDGTPLAHQPALPAAGMEGFEDVPEGPFNRGAETNRWTAGERAALTVAAPPANTPAIDPGDRVTVTISRNGHHIARLSMTA